MMSLAAGLRRNALYKSNKPALICGEMVITYRQFDDIAGKIAAALIDNGLQPGDRVALSCPNLPFFPLVYYGVQKAGGVVVPLNVLLKRREIQYHLEDSEAKFFFCFEGSEQLPMAQEGLHAFQQVDTCEQMIVMCADQKQRHYNEMPTLSRWSDRYAPIKDDVARDANDTAVILYTSGTTGQSKGAELTQSNMIMNALVTQGIAELTSRDVHIATLPLFHSFGQTVSLNAAILCGSTIVLVPRFEPAAVVKMIEQHNVTIFAGVPTMYIGLNHLDIDADLSSLKLGISGGSSMPAEVIRRFEDKFKVPVIEGYGLSETSPIVCFNHLDTERRVGSIGQPIQGVEVRLVDEQGQEVAPGQEGELTVRGHNVMKGYLNRPEETAAAMREGWFHTGDIARQDELGNVYIVDRVKDLIIRNGFNVYPREVEEVFMTHPAVAMVAVIGIPHEEYGEEIKAIVTLKPGANIEAAELKAWGKEQCAAYKYPRSVDIRDALPLGATGKILKKDLRAEYSQ
ncbi:long-chain-fatty-acid--CoA ligase [Vibrio aphrogenes]|uniref:long-chain-fatty-acid--CoA ligase n=1 Tax=Vibrio aphrogenes TaxID=1891186 RepID=UPI000B35063D|nr:long-chain fatty acid--CoA ligase [Vibrio aphrogenes]